MHCLNILSVGFVLINLISESFYNHMLVLCICMLIPRMIEKRRQLYYWRPDDLAALDKEADAGAGSSGTLRSRQAKPREPTAR